MASVLPDLGEDNLPIALLNKAAQQNDESIFDDVPEEPVEDENSFAAYSFNPEASVLEVWCFSEFKNGM